MTQPVVSRRGFLGVTAGTLAATSGVSAYAQQAPDDLYQEPARDIPLKRDADVIVCGGGPAGVTAAIAAARNGVKVRLFEAHGCLGGIWTSGYLGHLLDFNKPGFNQELVNILRERDAIRGMGFNALCYEPEEMKFTLEELCSAAGVTIQYHTSVVAAYRKGQQLKTILTESKSGREAWQAPVFIDTTGDGDVGALAGCEFEVGEAQDCPCQPMSLNALLVVKDVELMKPFIRDWGEGAVSSNQAKIAFRDAIRLAGHDPSYGMPTMFPVRDNLVLIMVNHEYGVKPFDSAGVTAATIRARAELNKIVKGLKKLGGPWEGVQLAATAEQIGIRDSRRIRGRYVVSQEDLVNGARHDDSVVRATFPVDIHAVRQDDSPYSNRGVKTKPYDIPIRALIARDVDGLLLAGRCISGDFIAHASYRVTGNAVAMGEAAGSLAAVAARSKRQPQDVPWAETQLAITAARVTA